MVSECRPGPVELFLLTHELKPIDCVSTPRLPSWTSSWNLIGMGGAMTPVGEL